MFVEDYPTSCTDRAWNLFHCHIWAEIQISVKNFALSVHSGAYFLFKFQIRNPQNTIIRLKNRKMIPYPGTFLEKNPKDHLKFFKFLSGFC